MAYQDVVMVLMVFGVCLKVHFKKNEIDISQLWWHMLARNKTLTLTVLRIVKMKPF